MQMDTDNTNDNQTFITPRKFSPNFEKLIREKTRKTLAKTNNIFQALIEHFDSEIDDDLGRIVKRKSVKAREAKSNEKPSDKPEETIESILAENKASNNKTFQKKVTPAPKNKNQNTLINDIKSIVTGKFSIKHTNNSTILFLEEKEDHEKMVRRIRAEKLPYITYTNREEKTHAFVLRGLADGTKIEDIDEDLTEEYDIKARFIFRMNTKNKYNGPYTHNRLFK